MRKPNKSTPDQLLVEKMNIVAELEYAVAEHYQEFKRLPKAMYLPTDLYQAFLKDPVATKRKDNNYFHGIIVKEL